MPSDITLVMDAMDLLHGGRFDGFCLMSADSDFTRLAARIREQGIDVFGFCRFRAGGVGRHGEDRRPHIISLDRSGEMHRVHADVCRFA
jgi:hypothetical protein